MTDTKRSTPTKPQPTEMPRVGKESEKAPAASVAEASAPASSAARTASDAAQAAERTGERAAEAAGMAAATSRPVRPERRGDAGEFRFAQQMALLTSRRTEAVLASSSAAARAIEALTHEAVSYSERSVRQASTTLRGFAEARSPTDIITLQSQFAQSFVEEMIEEAARMSDSLVRMVGEIVEPMIREEARGTMRPAA